MGRLALPWNREGLPPRAGRMRLPEPRSGRAIGVNRIPGLPWGDRKEPETHRAKSERGGIGPPVIPRDNRGGGQREGQRAPPDVRGPIGGARVARKRKGRQRRQEGQGKRRNKGTLANYGFPADDGGID